jgi:AsmA protein
LIVLGAVLANLGAFGAALAPWTFSGSALRLEVINQIRKSTGLTTLPRGRSSFAILPQPHIKIDDISFADTSGALIVNAEYLKGYLRILPLFAGRLEIATATLYRPEMVIDIDDKPTPDAGAIARAADAKPATPEAAASDTARLGIVSIVDGRAQLTSKFAHSNTQIDNINMTIDWRSISSPATLTGQVRWHDVQADVATWIAKPSELLRGDQSPVTFQIKSDLVSFSTNGIFSVGPRLQYEGRIAATAPSLRDFIRKTGYTLPVPGHFGEMVLGCDAKLTPHDAALSNLRLRLDGNDYEGTLAVQNDRQRPAISGTLASNFLSLKPYLTKLPAVLAANRQWNSEPFQLQGISFADLDLRISAARAVLGPVRLEDAAISLMTKNGHIDLTLAEAKAYNGLVKARASLATSDDEKTLEVRANGTMLNVDLASLSNDIFGREKFSGAATGSGNIEMSGDSIAGLMRNLDGRAQIRVTQGAILGVDFAKILSPAEKRPLQIIGELGSGQTPFDMNSFGIQLKKGTAEIDNGLLIGPDARLAFAGSASVTQRTWSIHATATPADAASQTTHQNEPANQFRFDILGSWDAPLLVPDALSLIRRSGIAPLLIPKAGSRPDKDKAPAEE